MGCNCNDRTYSISMGCCEPVLAPIENYYTKYQIDKMIESATTSGCCITPEEVDEKIASAKTEIENEIPTVPTSNTAFTNDAGYLTEHQSLSGYVTDAEMSAFTYDKATIDEKVAQGGTFDPTQYYNTAQTINLVESAVTRVEGEIPTVPTSNTAFTNDAGYLTEHQSLSGYATEQWVEDQHYITGVDLSNYATKAEIPVVPTSNTAFTNDAKYITSGNAQTQINNSISGKQNTLSAGTGIDITNDVISCTVTGGGASYSASSGISISNNEISTNIGGGLRYTQDGKVEVNSTNAIASGNTQVPLSYVVYNYVNNNCLFKNKIWCGTMAQYNSITNKDAETLYLIHD